MDLEHRKDGEAVIVIPHEPRLDAHVAGEFKDALKGLVNDGNDRIALHLEDVEFVDSSGLSAIVSTMKSLAGKGEIVISGAKPPVMNLLKLTRLDKVFRTYTGEAEALAALAG